MNDDERLLLSRLSDLFDREERSGMYTYSNFLSLPEQDLFYRSVREYGFRNFSFDGGYESAERRILIFGNEEELGFPKDPPLSVLRVLPLSEKYAEALSHRDVLGALMSLGIDRSLTGDIIIRGKSAFILCLSQISEYLSENLTKIRHTDVRVQVCTDEVPELKPVFLELSLNIASERIDSIVAGFAGISRSQVGRLFHEQRVFVNGQVTESLSARLKEGDVLTVRGFGKAIYEGISGSSKKGRLYVNLRKYA